MNLRAFLKGDTNASKTAAELEKFLSAPSFAAPKRTCPKLNYSASKLPKKALDENEYPATESAIQSHRLFSEGTPQKAPPRHDDPLTMHSVNSAEHKTGKPEVKVSSAVKIKEHVENTMRGFGVNLDTNRRNLDSQLQSAKQEGDNNIMGSMIEEIGRLNELLLDKITENEKLKKINVSLERKVIEIGQSEPSEGILKTEVLRKTSNELSTFDAKMRSLTQESLNSEEDSKLLDDSIRVNSKVLTPQNKWKTSRKNILNNNFGRTTGKKNQWEEKNKVEELTRTVENLNKSLSQKEGENSALKNEMEFMRKNYEGFSQKLLQQQQVTEKLRSELMNAHSQNQELSQRLTSLKETSSPKMRQSKVTTISFSRVDSPVASFNHQEGSEWQKKYEVTKNDNEKLIKIVEENHKTIQKFKEIFSDLEKRHNINYEELKKEYEGRIRGLTESRTERSEIRGAGGRGGEILNTSYGITITNSLSSSQFLRSTNDNLDLFKSGVNSYRA